MIRYPNNKLRETKELYSVINKKKQIYFTGNPQERKIASKEVQNEMKRKAKVRYREKIEMQYSGDNLQAAWHGIKIMASINNYATEEKQPIKVNGTKDSDLPNAFNSFFYSF